MSPGGLSCPLSSVSFERKLQFSASQDLRSARGKHWKLSQKENQRDVWTIKPLDVSVRLYTSLSNPPPRRQTRCCAQVPHGGKGRTIILPEVSHEEKKEEKKQELEEFVTLFRAADALECELSFIKSGKFPPEPYENRKPHNFRPLDETIPDMITSYDRDPGNLSFKLKHLDTLHTPRSNVDTCLRDTRTRMDTYKPVEPKWDVRLFLPQSPWPPKSASYTRHSRRRGAYSAFLERVEEKLSRSYEKKTLL